VAGRQRGADPERVDLRPVLHARVAELLEHERLARGRGGGRVRLHPERAPLRERDVRARVVEWRLPVERVPASRSSTSVRAEARKDGHVVDGEVDVLDAEVGDEVLARASVERVVIHTHCGAA
jgi:hypothetical protein